MSSTNELVVGNAKQQRRPTLDVIDPEYPFTQQRKSIIVNHTDIDVYELNPRLTTNKKFGEIKASIAARWLDQKLSITQRPGATRYLLKAGGGTRWHAIDQLLEETGNHARYGSYEVDFVPWAGEVDIILAHGTENMLRSGLNFFEQAMFEKNLREHIVEEDSAFNNASLRVRQDHYKQLGYSVSTAYLCAFDYINTRLLPDLEVALLNGMGPRTITAIKAVDTKYRKIAEQRNKTVALDYDEIYRASIRAVVDRVQSQAGEINVADLQHELAERIAQTLHTTPDDLLRPVSRALRPNQDVRPTSSNSPATPIKPIPTVAKRRAANTEQHHSTVSDPDLSVDSKLEKYREQGESISQTLAYDYGLLNGAYYAIPGMGLGYGVENPDNCQLITGNTNKDLDAVVVLRELYAIFWSLRELEISSGRLHREHPLMQVVSEHSTPTAISASKTLQSIPANRLIYRLQALRLHAAVAQSQGLTSVQRSLVERLDQLQCHAEQYATTLATLS